MSTIVMPNLVSESLDNKLKKKQVLKGKFAESLVIVVFGREIFRSSVLLSLT